MELVRTDIEALTKASIIPSGTPDAQIKIFIETCKQHKLSPFKKEIYLVRYGSQYAVIVGIDGFRQKAANTGQYAGIDDAKYDLDTNGSYKTANQLIKEKKLPNTCTVTVYRIVGGVRCPFTHTCVFKEFYPKVANGNGGYSKAAQMPFQMIAKCAEAFALKKGFSDALAGLHIQEEKEAFEGVQEVETEAVDISSIIEDIQKATSVERLVEIHKSTPKSVLSDVLPEFTKRKKELGID